MPDPQTSRPWTLLWGYSKTKVFGNQVTSVTELKARIRIAVECGLRCWSTLWKTLRVRLVKLQENAGSHVET